MSNTSAKTGSEVGGKTPVTTYVVSSDASKNNSNVISYAEWLQARRSLAKSGSTAILAGQR